MEGDDERTREKSTRGDSDSDSDLESDPNHIIAPEDDSTGDCTGFDDADAREFMAMEGMEDMNGIAGAA